MIKYNNSNISDWNYGSDNIVKVYRNNAVCYYKITGGGDTPTAQTPCFAVVDDISQYQDTEFVDVFNKADGKWYKHNNLNQYEEYGIYGSGRNITYYEGKLTVDDGYEYIYSGASWVNVGEVSGGTASLPNVPFTVNFNAKNYDSQTKTLLKTSGQLADVDAVITAGTPTVNDGYLTIASGTRATISGYQTYFNRNNSNPNLTIISKQRTEGGNCHMFANRDSNYNWMYRCYSYKLTLHGASEQGSVAVTTQPVIESVRVNSSRLATYNNYTDNTSSTQSSFKYGGTNSGGVALFQGYATNAGEYFVGDFYWVYMSQNTLTDDQVQQVIAYNEGGGGEPTYPMYYAEMQDPPDNLTFSTMAEAEAYECPWVGMQATINGDNYIFSGDSQSGYEWVYNPSRLPDGYTEVEYVENTSTAFIDTGFKPNQNTDIYLTTQCVSSTSGGRHIGAGGYEKVNTINFDYETGAQGTLHISWGGNAGWTIYSSCVGDYNKHTYAWLGSGTFVRDSGTSEEFTATASYGNYQCTDNLGIFTRYQNGSGGGANECFKGKVFYFKMYDNGTLIRDLVPCTRDSDSKYGMYDLVTNTFYLSPNNVDFTGGDPV